MICGGFLRPFLIFINTSMNFFVLIFFYSFNYIPRNGISESVILGLACHFLSVGSMLAYNALCEFGEEETVGAC